MTFDDKKLVVLVCLITVGCLAVGLHGVINRKKRNSESDYYMSLNILLEGILFFPCAVFTLFYFWKLSQGITFFHKNIFGLAILAYGGIAGLVVGIHGLKYKKKINDQAYDRFSEAWILTFVLVVVGIAAWVWLWGWPWDPHILFEWQKMSPYYNEIISQ